MSVRKHPTKKEPNWWYISYRPDGYKGKQANIPFHGSLEAAYSLEKKLRRKTAKPLDLQVTPTILELVPGYLAHYKLENSPRSYGPVKSCVYGHIVPFFGKLRPQDLSPAIIESYKKQRLKNVKPRTINIELSALSSLLKWAAENDYAEPLSFQIKRFSKKKTQPPKVTPLTKNELARLYGYIPAKYRLAAMLMGDLGLRKSETFNLKAEHVDIERETITVFGKGAKYRHLPFTTERLTVVLLDTIRKRTAGYLLLNSKGKKMGSIKGSLKTAARNAGIKQHVTHHLLRHSFATNAAMDGVLPVALQQLMGHADLTTTMKVYVQVQQTFVRNEARKIRAVEMEGAGRKNEKWETLTDDELQVLLWKKPLTKLGVIFGVSGTAIAKRAKKKGLVTPPRGYWQREK